MKRVLTWSLTFMTFISYAGVKKKNFFPIWTFHRNNTNIHGISVGIASLPDWPKNTNTNGLKIELIGSGLLASFAGPSYVPEEDSTFYQLENDNVTERVNGIALAPLGTLCNCNINGVALGIGGLGQRKLNGLSVGIVNLTGRHNGIKIANINMSYSSNGVNIAFSNHASKFNGIQLGGLSNNAKKMNGAQASLMWNECDQMKGFQCSIVNKSKHTRGIQIGLWNVNEKRKLPIINWNFSDRTRKTASAKHRHNRHAHEAVALEV